MQQEIASARVYEIRLRVISTRRLANVHFVDPKVGDRDQAVAAYLASLFDPASVEILDCELVAEAGEIIPALPEVYQPSNRTSLGRIGRTDFFAGGREWIVDDAQHDGQTIAWGAVGTVWRILPYFRGFVLCNDRGQYLKRACRPHEGRARAWIFTTRERAAAHLATMEGLQS